ncbi:iron-containing redox enzyme family protein [Xenorhabdus bovienii]|nr:iron-containing redox enzyme family protein [Xenorhabdus bovienii]
MQTSSQRFITPKLRAGVQYFRHGEEHHLDYRQQGVILYFNPKDNSLDHFLNDLIQGGYSVTQLKTNNPQINEEIDEIIEQLDNHYLLTESHFEPIIDTLSGEQFSRQLQRYTRAWHAKLGTSALFSAMREGTFTRSQLIGFAIEYYHIVKMAPSIIAPAMSHKVPEPIFQGIKNLFLEEHDHETMLLEALEAIGIDGNKVKHTTPLPATFSVYCTLGTFARQHLLSFISALFLFEEPYPEFNDAFISSCQKVGLPDAFWKPIVGHSAVNETAGHHLITDELLCHLSAISAEETQVTLIHILTLLETMKIWDAQVCESYQSELNLRIYQ